MGEVSLYRVILSYLERLPGALTAARCIEGSHWQRRETHHALHLYSASLRATTATLLLDGAVDIRKVKELLDNRHVTTTQIYDKRRRGTSDSASHLLVI